MSSTTSRATARSSQAQINKFLIKIDEKSKQLKVNGLTRSDQELLRDRRLKTIWGEPDKKPDCEELSATTWRRARARRIYGEIQNLSNHLFLAFVLVVPPTTCTKASFNSVVEHLTRLESYDQYLLDLSPLTKSFFESTAVEQGFIRNCGYLQFIQVLFPQRDEPRHIQFAYSQVPFEDMAAFFERIQQGIYTSQQMKKEEERGSKTTSCVTVLVPNGQRDSICNIIIDRQIVIDVIGKFKLSQIKLE